MTDYPVAIPLLAIHRLRCPKCRTRMMLACISPGPAGSELKHTLGNVPATRRLGVRQGAPNEIYLEAAIRTGRWNAAVRQRRVGERRGRLAVPKQGRVGIARCQIVLA